MLLGGAGSEVEHAHLHMRTDGQRPNIEYWAQDHEPVSQHPCLHTEIFGTLANFPVAEIFAGLPLDLF
jgi:hypothetical protein